MLFHHICHNGSFIIFVDVCVCSQCSAVLYLIWILHTRCPAFLFCWIFFFLYLCGLSKDTRKQTRFSNNNAQLSFPPLHVAFIALYERRLTSPQHFFFQFPNVYQADENHNSCNSKVPLFIVDISCVTLSLSLLLWRLVYFFPSGTGVWQGEVLLGLRSLQCPLMWTDIINDIAQSDARWRPGLVCVCVAEREKKGMVREEKMRKHGEPHLMQLMCRFM